MLHNRGEKSRTLACIPSKLPPIFRHPRCFLIRYPQRPTNVCPVTSFMRVPKEAPKSHLPLNGKHSMHFLQCLSGDHHFSLSVLHIFTEKRIIWEMRQTMSINLSTQQYGAENISWGYYIDKDPLIKKKSLK